MKRQSLYFIEPGIVEVRGEIIPELGSDQVLVQVMLSGISSGTEMLIYQGKFPDEIALDEEIDAISGTMEYPLKYGYSTAGEIVAVGDDINQELIGKQVFSFQPHVSHYVSDLDSVHFIPPGISLEDAIFIPNMETAVNFLMDGSPIIGEIAIVLGQGVVGLLTTALLSKYPLTNLVTIDRYPIRRKASLEFGAQVSVNPPEKEEIKELLVEQFEQNTPRADLVFELTGDPKGLDLAVQLCGYDGRIVVGSFYGKKRADMDLGGWFHRSRIRMISSQVSTIAPAFSGRWDKSRRFKFAWEMIEQVRPARLITHRYPIENAGDAYQMLSERPEKTIQVAFTY